MPTLTLDRPGWLLGLLNLALGVVLLLGDPLRTSSPSFAAARTLCPISVWGLLFLLGGVICLLAVDLGRWGAVLVGIGAGIHAFWAAALIQSATWDQRAALTGCVVYSWITLVHLVTAGRLARQVR